MYEMKNSNISWINKIPSHWKVEKIKYHANKIERGTSPEYTDEPFTKVVNQATFSKGFFDKSNIRFSTKPADTSRGLLKIDDVLLASTGGGVLGKTHLFQEEDTYVADGHVTIIRTNQAELNSAYLCYFLKINYETINAMLAVGSTNQTELQRDLLSNMYIPYPPITEQKCIVDFLDHKCGEIDALIVDIQSQIDILEQYKRSIIFETISKGIREEKLISTDSDVWSMIPCSWKLKDIKYIFEIVKRIAGREGIDVLSVTQKGLKVKNINSNEGQLAENYSNYQYVYPTDYVMNHMDLLTGWVDCSTQFGVTSPDYRVFRLLNKEENDLSFWKYVMQCCYLCRIFYSLGQGVSNLGRWRLQTSTFMNFKVPVPPIQEQKEIANFLDSKITKIDKIIEQKKEQLSVLEDYKKSLIYEYVTGKKEVE